MQAIQGYCPAYRDNTSKGRGRLFYVAFNGGTTRDFLQAFCEPEERAWSIARRATKSLWHVPCVIPIDENCEPILD